VVWITKGLKIAYNKRMYFDQSELIKIALAVLAGGLIGVEREFRDKAAGFRTLIFICVGATLFTIVSIKMGGSNDQARIAAQIVTGVGFLGAGAIMRDTQRVTGLTTAAAIWLTAALGMGIGAGEYALSGVVTAVSLIVLWFFPYLERWINSIREDHTYEVVFRSSPEELHKLEEIFRTNNLRTRRRSQSKTGGLTTCIWYASGHPRNHEAFRRQLLEDVDVVEFHF
jgi:putative Mg2+ transporter-C (MgtC) family protein